MLDIEPLIQPLYNLPCWQVIWDSNTNITLNFGDPSLDVREPKQVDVESERVRELFARRHVAIRGEWLLWILQAYWQLSLRDGTRTTSTTPTRQKLHAINRLDGQKLLQVTIAPKTSQTVFTFDLGAQLIVRRQQRQPEELWTLYTPNNYVLSIRGDGYGSYEPSDQSEKWQILALTNQKARPCQ